MVKGDIKESWGLILAIILALLLAMIFVIMKDQIWATIKPLGKGIINALNDMVAGKPPWL